MWAATDIHSSVTKVKLKRKLEKLLSSKVYITKSLRWKGLGVFNFLLVPSKERVGNAANTRRILLIR